MVSLGAVVMLASERLPASESPAVAEVRARVARGEAVMLAPGTVLELEAPLVLRHAGQRVGTEGSPLPRDYATIRLAAGSAASLVEARGVRGIALSHLILEGNREGFPHEAASLPHEPMVSLGGEGGDDQRVFGCLLIDSRSSGGWGTLHVREGARGVRLEHNVLFGAGSDVRGNGRAGGERPFGFADGISTASRDSVIRQNLIYDATDEGIMIQGAPGSIVSGNVVAALSREMLGGIALIDPTPLFPLGGAESGRHDYRGVVVEENWVDARGARIHAALPLGGAAWHGRLDRGVLVGAVVRNNRISGEAAAYGLVANGIDGFTITGNESTATYSGPGDGMPGRPVDPPTAFLYEPEAVGDSRLQAEFRAARESATRVLRSNREPANALGFRVAPYGEAEARAIVAWAALEMLGRAPRREERTRWEGWLRNDGLNADVLRIRLRATVEAAVEPASAAQTALHEARTRRWKSLILDEWSALRAEGAELPAAAVLHEHLVEALSPRAPLIHTGLEHP